MEPGRTTGRPARRHTDEGDRSPARAAPRQCGRRHFPPRRRGSAAGPAPSGFGAWAIGRGRAEPGDGGGASTMATTPTGRSLRRPTGPPAEAATRMPTGFRDTLGPHVPDPRQVTRCGPRRTTTLPSAPCHRQIRTAAIAAGGAGTVRSGPPTAGHRPTSGWPSLRSPSPRPVSGCRNGSRSPGSDRSSSWCMSWSSRCRSVVHHADGDRCAVDRRSGRVAHDLHPGDGVVIAAVVGGDVLELTDPAAQQCGGGRRRRGGRGGWRRCRGRGRQN